MPNWWNATRTEALRRLAASGLSASVIAVEIGSTKKGVLRKCLNERILVNGDTSEERAARKQRKKEKRRKNARPIFVALISKTSAKYRRTLRPAPDMTPNERRNMLAEAVRNTAAMRIK